MSKEKLTVESVVSSILSQDKTPTYRDCLNLQIDFLKQIRDEIIDATLTGEHKYINIIFDKYLNEK